MNIYRKSSTKGLWSRVYVPDVEYAIAIALNSTEYSLT